MFGWLIKTIVGGLSYKSDPIGTGAIFLRDCVKKRGVNADSIPMPCYVEIARYIHRTDSFIIRIHPDRNLLEMYVESLDAISEIIALMLAGRLTNKEMVDVNWIYEILAKYKTEHPEADF